MTVNEIGAMALALAIACAIASPIALGPMPTLRWRHPDRVALDDAGWRRGMRAWETVRLAVIAGTVLVAWAVNAPLVTAAAAGVAPSIVIRLRAAAQRDAAVRETTTILQLAHAALRSTTQLPEALRISSANAGPLARRPFAVALREFDMGASLDDALRAAARAATSRRVAEALDALALGVGEHLSTARCATLVGGVIDRLVHDERLADEVEARTSGIRSQVVLLAAVVPGIALYLALTMPGLAATLSSPLGRFVLVPAATALEVAGIVASRRIVRSIGR